MFKLKSLIQEELEEMRGIKPRDIYNFYFLWYTSTNNPSLVNTPFGKEILNHYLQMWKKKYVEIFRSLIATQIAKYIERKRVDSDFPVDVISKLPTMSASALRPLMAKTFRSDMKRRNDVWNLIAEFTENLEKSHLPKDIFVYINQLNNAVHNTQQRALDKLSNYHLELVKAFDFVDKVTNPTLQLKGLVDKDLRDLWDQDNSNGPDSLNENDLYHYRVMLREGLEKLLRLK